MAKCVYPKCYSCALEYCIKGTQASKKECKKIDRTAYQKEYYQNNKAKIKERHNSQVQYIRWIEIKKTINRLKKDIGLQNYELLMDELEKIKKYKYS